MTIKIKRNRYYCVSERGTEASGLVCFNDCDVDELRRASWIAIVMSDYILESKERARSKQNEDWPGNLYTYFILLRGWDQLAGWVVPSGGENS